MRSLRRVVWVTLGCPRSAGTVHCRLSGRCPHSHCKGGKAVQVLRLAASSAWRIAAGNADARSAVGRTQHARRSRGRRGARRTVGTATGKRMLMAKATRGCEMGRGRASPSCSNACAASASNSAAGGATQIKLYYYWVSSICNDRKSVANRSCTEGVSDHPRHNRHEMYAQTQTFHMH